MFTGQDYVIHAPCASTAIKKIIIAGIRLHSVLG